MARYFPPLLKTTPAGGVTLLVDPSTEIGKYITSAITADQKNPNDPAVLLDFVTAHDAKAKAAVGIAIVAAGAALLVWWGQKKGNLPKGLEFIRNKMVFWGILAVCAFFIFKGYQLSQKNTQIKQSLASFIAFMTAPPAAAAPAATQQQQLAA